MCKKELALVRGQPMINHQMVLPDCNELPRIGTPEAYNCVRMGIPHVNREQLIKPMLCYSEEDGSDYRGTISVTAGGLTCKPWHLNFSADSTHGFEREVALMGGHNYCRNPPGAEREDRPWCYTNDPR